MLVKRHIVRIFFKFVITLLNRVITNGRAGSDKAKFVKIRRGKGHGPKAAWACVLERLPLASAAGKLGVFQEREIPAICTENWCPLRRRIDADTAKHGPICVQV